MNGADRKTWKGKKREYALSDFDQAGPTTSALVNRLLRSRGVSPEDAGPFLDPDFERHVHDPFIMKDMEKAVARLLKAIEKNERIAIYSDYDADGIPGGVILHDLLKRIGHSNFVNYIPHRHEEGFGLNAEAVGKLAQDGVTLMITVDCGVTDVDEVSLAAERGMDVIITDHHLPGEVIPNAYAIVDPKQEGCTYPYKELCGAGVAWKLSQGVLSKNRFGIREGWEKWLLDMAGLATLSDMVPLTGENRVIAFYGLKVLRKTPRLGLLKLARRMNLNMRHLTEDDVGFTITPRLNAASRMGVPMEAFTLLSTSDETEADRMAEYLNRINDERKGVVASMVREAKKHFDERHESGAMRAVLVAGNPDWRPSLLGLVANSLVDEYKRPVFLWGREGGSTLKGSCRSDGTVNVVALMERAKDMFIDYGGHKMSGGFSLTLENVDRVEDELVKAHEAFNLEGAAGEAVMVDGIMPLDDVSWKTYEDIEKLAPFGLGNPKPLFAFEGLAPETVRTFGKGNLHTEASFRTPAGRDVKAIAFFSQPDGFTVPLAEGSKVTLIAHVEKSMFRNSAELRLRIVDVLP